MEHWMNRLTDMDWGWWPFLGLRPPRTAKMTTGVVTKISVYFGSLYGLVFYVALVLPREGWVLTAVVQYQAMMIPGFFLLYRPTFAYSWNLRASRLQAEVAQARDAGQA